MLLSDTTTAAIAGPPGKKQSTRTKHTALVLASSLQKNRLFRNRSLETVIGIRSLKPRENRLLKPPFSNRFLKQLLKSVTVNFRGPRGPTQVARRAPFPKPAPACASVQPTPVSEPLSPPVPRTVFPR